MVCCRPGGVLSAVLAVEQRHQGHCRWRRRLDQQSPHEQARRLASHLCLHWRARVGHARLARWHASRTRAGHKRTARRAVGKRCIARRDRDRAGRWWSCRRAGASTVDCPAAESHALLQRSIGGGYPVELPIAEPPTSARRCRPAKADGFTSVRKAHPPIGFHWIPAIRKDSQIPSG